MEGIHDIPFSESTITEEVPLIITTPTVSLLKRRYRNTRKCITSKAALLVLLWAFILPPGYVALIHPELLHLEFLKQASKYAIHPTVLLLLIVQCFFPLAGHLADTKIGRYKTIILSLWITMLALLATFLGAQLLFLTSLDLLGIKVNVSLSVIGGALLVAGFVLLILGNAGFSANIIQFGLDQLYEAPGEDQSLFIHWYFWANSTAELIIGAILNLLQTVSTTKDLLITRTCLFVLVPATVISVLALTLYITNRKKYWFLIEPRRPNMYRLVHKVTQFSLQHKAPLNRSAFTYCEDELPLGLDLGKNKYGGPFTTEQVEEVKAFYGIVKVLFAVGLVVFTEMSIEFLQHSYERHALGNPLFVPKHINGHQEEGDNYTSNPQISTVFFGGNIIYSLITCVCIPLYLIVLRPLFINHIPGMLKRIGIGMILIVLSSISTLILDIIIETEIKVFGCTFDDNNNYTYANSTKHPLPTELERSIAYVPLFQEVLSALSNMLISIGAYEFICSQSPSSMKGVLIGLLYAIRGLAGILTYSLIIFLSLGWHTALLPSCDIIYNVVIALISLVAMVVYVTVAKKYKFKVRDEPCNDYRYVDDYYYKIHQHKLKLNED